MVVSKYLVSLEKGPNFAFISHWKKYIGNKNFCSGATGIDLYLKGDIDFFVNLYIGMQTIQFSMEHLLYDIVPSNPSMVSNLTNQDLLLFRQYVFDYTEERVC